MVEERGGGGRRERGVPMMLTHIRQRLLDNNITWRSTKAKPLLSERQPTSVGSESSFWDYIKVVC